MAKSESTQNTIGIFIKYALGMGLNIGQIEEFADILIEVLSAMYIGANAKRAKFGVSSNPRSGQFAIACLQDINT